MSFGTEQFETDVPEVQSSLSDNSLLQQYRDGSEDAAAELYHRYATRLRALVRSKTSPALARHVDDDDLVQSVFRIFFGRARRGLYDVPRGEDLWKLLLVLAMNKIRRKWAFHTANKRDLKSTVSLNTDSASDHNALDDSGSQPWVRLLMRELLEELSPLEHNILALRMEGYKVDEIAQQVGSSKRTVERTLQQAREHLKRHFEEQ